MLEKYSMNSFILDIPKVELHLHIEGTLEPELMLAIARRNGLRLPFQSVDQARQAYKFTDLQSFLNIYYQGAKILLHERDFYDLTWAYLTRNRGVPFETVVTGIHRALSDAQAELGIPSRLIMCLLRDRDADEAMKTFQTALPFKGWIVGVGLDSAELGHPPENFTRVFEKALEERMLTVAHAGEEGPPE